MDLDVKIMDLDVKITDLDVNITDFDVKIMDFDVKLQDVDVKIPDFQSYRVEPFPFRVSLVHRDKQETPIYMYIYIYIYISRYFFWVPNNLILGGEQH